MTWLREFRVLFGCTSGATAAVLAVFLGGLGLGNAFFGWYLSKPKIDAIKVAGLAEGVIACLAILSPTLVEVAQRIYYGLGGEREMGYFLTTVCRLALTTLIIGLPCFLMGASFLAISAVMQRSQDRVRKSVSSLYSLNALGGGIGVVMTAFYFLEHFGNERTLMLAGGLNLVLAVVLYRSAGAIRPPQPIVQEEEGAREIHLGSLIRKRVGYLAAFLSGLVFFILEILWYRLTIPLTGGSHYSLTLVLIIAMLGIYLGSALYAGLLCRAKSLFLLLATTLALQGALALLPYLGGEYFAWFSALVTHFLQSGSFSHRVLSWAFICVPIVLPASIIAGVQFPLIISILGRGRDHLAHQVSGVYALNAIGSIAGALLGTFVLLPLFGSDQLLLICGLFLVGLGGSVLALEVFKIRREVIGPFRSFFFLAAVVAVLSLMARGPEAMWKYSSIGFGRVTQVDKTMGEMLAMSQRYHAEIAMAQEGRECSVAVSMGGSPAILTNGKSDSSIHGDIATTIGSGLIPYFLYPGDCKSIGIIGIGTGITAGSLTGFADVEKVTLFEIEPEVVEAQRFFAEANENILENPKVEIVIGDARECLSTSREKFHFIGSEPSNLSKAGICQLYTVEHFRQASLGLTEDGIYAQWIQAYNISLESLQQVVYTMKQVFPKVELWMPAGGDLLVIGYKDGEYRHDLARMKEKVQSRHGRELLWRGFLSDSVESVYARMLATDDTLVRKLPSEIRANTDDRNTLEFRVARQNSSGVDLTAYLSEAFGEYDLPDPVKRNLNAVLLREERIVMLWGSGRAYGLREPELAAFFRFENDGFKEFFDFWSEYGKGSLKGRLYSAMALSSSNLEGKRYFRDLPEVANGYPDLLRGINLIHQDRFDQGLSRLREGVEQVRGKRWIHGDVADYVMMKLAGLAKFMTESQLETVFGIFEEPLPSFSADDRRMQFLSHLAYFLSDEYKVRVVKQYSDRPCLMPQLLVMAKDFYPLPEYLEQYDALNSAGFNFKKYRDLQQEPGMGKIIR